MVNVTMIQSFKICVCLLIVFFPGCSRHPSRSPVPEIQLRQAIENSDAETVQKLLSEGVSTDAKYFRGGGDMREITALHIAVLDADKQYEMVKLLLDAGVSANSQDSSGAYPLHAAVTRGMATDRSLELFELLMTVTRDVDVTDMMGESPLFYCAEEGHVRFAELLLSAGADVNLQSNSGWTAAHLAAQQRQLEFLRFLKKNGADFSKKTKRGETVNDLMQANNVDITFDIGVVSKKPDRGLSQEKSDH